MNLPSNGACGFAAVRPTPQTGDAGIDAAVDAGPRLLSPDLLSPEQRLELAKSTAHGPYLEACRDLAQDEIAEMHQEEAVVSAQNRIIEQEISEYPHKLGSYALDYRIPLGMFLKFRDIYGWECWQDKAFVEDTLKHHPGLKINIKRS